jgi:hypothetical protein
MCWGCGACRIARIAAIIARKAVGERMQELIGGETSAWRYPTGGPTESRGSASSELSLVSTGLPVHNGNRYLEPAVRSVLDPDLPDFELTPPTRTRSCSSSTGILLLDTKGVMGLRPFVGETLQREGKRVCVRRDHVLRPTRN